MKPEAQIIMKLQDLDGYVALLLLMLASAMV
jgi:hypothetical protein